MFDSIFAFIGSIGNGFVKNLFDGEWLGGEALSWLLFTVAAGLILLGIDRAREKRRREPYENWYLHVIGYKDPPMDLDAEEVRRFLNSKFELWKFVKSVASGTHELSLRNIEQATDVWVHIDPGARRITVELYKIVERKHGELRQKAEQPTDPDEPAAATAAA